MLDVRLVIPAVILWITGAVFVLMDVGKNWANIAILLVGLLVVALLYQTTFRICKKVMSQVIFCVLLVSLQLISFNSYLQFSYHDDLVGQTTHNSGMKVIIKSTPSMQDSFGITKCSYQTEGFAPHGYYTLQTGTKSGDTDCSLDYGGTYLVSGKFAEDDFHQKNSATIVVDKAPEILVEPNVIDQVCNNIHSSFLKIAKKLNGNAPALVPGMSIGDTRLMDKSLSDATKISSLTHLTAISGSHFVIIISMIGALLGLLKMNRKLLAGLQILSVILLVELVHPTDSVKRAAIMSIIGLSGVWLNRRAVSLSALGAVICGWLLIDPHLACSYGFALSSAATASIILFSAPLTRKLTPYLGKILASLLSVPIVAQVGCTPILLLMTDYISPLGALANLLVTPVIEPATILALFACLVSPLNAGLSYIIASISGLFTEFVANVAYLVAGLPLAKINWQSGTAGAVTALVICVMISLMPKFYKLCYTAIMRRALPESTSLPMRMYSWRNKQLQMARDWQNRHDRHIRAMPKKKRIRRVIIGIIFASLVGILIGAIILLNPVDKIKGLLSSLPSVPATWQIAACDVGQGDAAAIRVGEHSAILVDTGPGNLETGGESINDCLKRLQVDSIELLSISHYHDDHIGGLAELLTKYKPKHALLPPVKSPQNNHDMVVKLLERGGVDYKYASVGDGESYNCAGTETNPLSMPTFITSSSQNCTKWTVLSIFGLDKQINTNSSSSSKKAAEDDLENNSSVNIVFNVHGVKYWTAGDLEADGDKSALTAFKASGLEGVDIVKVNHHGSKTQNKTLNSLLNPSVALFMVGKNSYGHPAADVMGSFKDNGAKILRTDQNGLCGVYFDSNPDSGQNLVIFRSK